MRKLGFSSPLQRVPSLWEITGQLQLCTVVNEVCLSVGVSSLNEVGREWCGSMLGACECPDVLDRENLVSFGMLPSEAMLDS